MAGMWGRAVAGAAVFVSVALASAAPAVANTSAKRPVPSLQPAATEKLWRQLVAQPRPRRFALADCRPARVVFYAQTDWMRLATKLAANASPCAEYYVSVPPLSADKTQARVDQAWRIRGLGPNFHALAEISWNGWSSWVTANAASWYAAGVEARRRAAAAGYDVSGGDTWALNELSSAVRRGDGSSRTNAREFVRGLYEGDGTPSKGVVFVSGMGQSTADLSTYKANLQRWLQDSPFWTDMAAYVSDWSQETYGDARLYGVADASMATRGAYVGEYLQHELTLAKAGPAEIDAARSFLEARHGALANGAWAWDAAYGWTAVPFAQMQDYVSAQVYAHRSAGQAVDRIGFAWAPKNLTALSTTDYNAQTAAILDRLAAAVRDSGAAPEAACAPAGENVWCAAAVEGAAFTDTWKTFATWSTPALTFASAPVTATAGLATGPISIELQNAGVTESATSATDVQLTSSSATGTFSAGADGPWASTLTVTVPAGASGAGFYYRDARTGAATISATSAGRAPAAQAVTVVAGPVTSVTVSPPLATVAGGTTQAFTASAADAYGNEVAATPVWTSSLGTVSPAGVFTAPAFAASGMVTATIGGVSASANVAVTTPVVRVSSIRYATSNGRLVVTFTATDASTGAAVPGVAVSFTIKRNSYAWVSGSGTTGSGGSFSVSTPTAPSGCYTTALRSVTTSGFAWDGVTPSNGFCK